MHFGIWQGAVGEMKGNNQAAGQASSRQTSTLRATAVAAFRQFNTASSLGWLRQQTSHMDDNSPTNTIASRQGQADITQLTAKPVTHGLDQPRSTEPGSGGREAQGAHRPSMEGPRTLSEDTSETRKGGRARQPHIRRILHAGQ